MTAQVANDVASLAACADALLLDERYGALVFPHTAATRVGLQRLQILEEAAARRGKMVCVVWLSGWLEGPGATEAEQFGHCAVFRSVDSCMRALSARGHPAVDTHTDGSTVTTPAHAKRKEAARRLMASIAAHDLTETEGLQLLSLYGIAVPDGRIGQDADAAAHAACAMGFPVVMKVVSRDIAHKSDVGGVRLDVRDEQQARDAYTDILQSTAQARPAARVEGVLVQSMAGRGLELFAGTRRDPVFGVLVVVGFGGVLVEVLRDIAVGIAPVDHRQACAMVRSLRGARLLEGLRGQPSVDVDALAACVVRLSDLATDLAHAVAEIDVNPLICSGGSILAVDALVRR
jgi:acetyl-CoA synthetase